MSIRAAKRLEELKTRQAKEREKLELEMSLLNLLSDDSPECSIFAYTLYGRVATLTFMQSDLDWVLEHFKPLEILVTTTGARSFIANTAESVSNYEKDSKTTFSNAGKFIVEFSFLECNCTHSGKIQFFSYLGEYLVEINIKLDTPRDYIQYWNAKPRARVNKEYRWRLSNKVSSKVSYCRFWASIPGTGNVIIYNTDCEELSDLLDI